jgi:hypothetical protein
MGDLLQSIDPVMAIVASEKKKDKKKDKRKDRAQAANIKDLTNAANARGRSLGEGDSLLTGRPGNATSSSLLG